MAKVLHRELRRSAAHRCTMLGRSQLAAISTASSAPATAVRCSEHVVTRLSRPHFLPPPQFRTFFRRSWEQGSCRQPRRQTRSPVLFFSDSAASTYHRSVVPRGREMGGH